MQILKFIGLGIVGIIVLLLIVAAFIPNKYTVSVSETINRPKAEVFDYVKMIKNQEQYSVWITQDTTVKVTYQNEDGKVGLIAKWDNGKDNKGEQEITKLTENRVDVDLRFEKPFKDNQKAATFVKEVSPTQTIVTNEFYGTTKWPMGLMSLIGKKIIKDAQTQNLKNLKAILEKSN